LRSDTRAPAIPAIKNLTENDSQPDAVPKKRLYRAKITTTSLLQNIYFDKSRIYFAAQLVRHRQT
jgi:hypothetical protein